MSVAKVQTRDSIKSEKKKKEKERNTVSFICQMQIVFTASNSGWGKQKMFALNSWRHLRLKAVKVISGGNKTHLIGIDGFNRHGDEETLMFFFLLPYRRALHSTSGESDVQTFLLYREDK